MPVLRVIVIICVAFGFVYIYPYTADLRGQMSDAAAAWWESMTPPPVSNTAGVHAQLDGIVASFTSPQPISQEDTPFTQPMLTDREENDLIAKFKKTWRAQDGESADEIVEKVRKVAQFFPREWSVAYTSAGQRSIVLSWSHHSTDDEGDGYSIGWDVNPDGSFVLEGGVDKTMELGWKPFALSLIDGEVVEGRKKPNLRFLHDLTNLNFVATPQGMLGNLLAKGKCSLGDPVSVAYVVPPRNKTTSEENFWRVQLSVDCKIRGPRYFVKDGNS